MFLKAHMRDGEEWRDVMISNISTSGLMVKSRMVPQMGTDVEIRRRGMVITGEVVWTTSTRFGLRSFAPIDVEALTAQSGLNTDMARGDDSARPWFWHWRTR